MIDGVTIQQVIERRLKTYPSIESLHHCIFTDIEHRHNQISSNLLLEAKMLYREHFFNASVKELTNAYDALKSCMMEGLRRLFLEFYAGDAILPDDSAHLFLYLPTNKQLLLYIRSYSDISHNDLALYYYFLFAIEYWHLEETLVSQEKSGCSTEESNIMKTISDLSYLSGVSFGIAQEINALKSNAEQLLANSIKSDIVKSAGQRGMEKRWEPLKERINDWKPLVVALAEQGMMHTQMAQQIIKRKDTDGVRYSEYRDSHKVLQEISATTIRGHIKDILKEIGRADLISGRKKGGS